MSCPLHLTLNLDERLSYMATLPPSPTHVATSFVARISIVHQTPKPKQHMPGATHARFDRTSLGYFNFTQVQFIQMIMMQMDAHCANKQHIYTGEHWSITP